MKNKLVISGTVIASLFRFIMLLTSSVELQEWKELTFVIGWEQVSSVLKARCQLRSASNFSHGNLKYLKRKIQLWFIGSAGNLAPCKEHNLNRLCTASFLLCRASRLLFPCSCVVILFLFLLYSWECLHIFNIYRLRGNHSLRFNFKIA